MVILISLLTAVATFLGGLFALKFKDQLHLILGFSAGAVLGVAFFDLLPEAMNLGSSTYSISSIASIVAVGFVFFMALDRFFSLHAHDNEHCENINHRGKLGVATLSLHSLLDGVAIGLAFQVSPAIGAVVAVAVLVHDFSDGVNTISFVIKNNGSQHEAFRWLFLDALAPTIGAFLTLFFSLPATVLGVILALFCGFFLYIGTSDLLPESHHRHSSFLTTLMTLLGMLVLYGAIHLAGI